MITRLNQFSETAIRDFLTNQKTLPYLCDGYYVSRDAVVEQVLAEMLAQGECSRCVGSESQIKAALVWRLLEWDTQELRRPVARIDHFYIDQTAEFDGVAGLVTRIVDIAQDAGIEYMTCRVLAQSLLGIHALEASGFRLIDGINKLAVDLTQDRKALSGEPSRIEVSEHRVDDWPELGQIARCAFIFGRFHADPVISKEMADRVYEDWVRNACSGWADVVLVARKGSKPVGFIVCKIDRMATDRLNFPLGTIVLVAVSGEHRGQGVAGDLAAASLRWFWQRAISTVQVGTQLANAAANRAYQKADFRFVSARLTFRNVLSR